MAVVTYTDADGVEHWADEHSKAYEKHLKAAGPDSTAENPTPSQTPADVKGETPATTPQLSRPDVKTAEPKKL